MACEKCLRIQRRLFGWFMRPATAAPLRRHRQIEIEHVDLMNRQVTVKAGGVGGAMTRLALPLPAGPAPTPRQLLDWCVARMPPEAWAYADHAAEADADWQALKAELENRLWTVSVAENSCPHLRVATSVDGPG